MNRQIIKIFSIFIAISIGLTGPVYPRAISEYTLTPELRSTNHDFRRTFLATEICTYIEKSGLAESCEEIHKNLSKIEMPNILTKLSGVQGEHELYIVDPVDPEIIIRYFNPSKANLLTPYLVLSRLETKVILPTLHRQILVLKKSAKPPLGRYDEKDSEYLEELIDFAEEKIKKGELDPILPVAAMIVDRNGRVIVKSIRKNSYSSTKYGVRALHAEIAALYEALEAGFDDWSNATMYVTLQASYNCHKELKEEYSFERVVYGLPKAMSVEYTDTFSVRGLAPEQQQPIVCKDAALTRRIRGLVSDDIPKGVTDVNDRTYRRAVDEGITSRIILQMEDYKDSFRDEIIAAQEFKSRYERMFEEEIDVMPLNVETHKNFWEAMGVTADPVADTIQTFVDLLERDRVDKEKAVMEGGKWEKKRRIILLSGNYEASREFRKELIDCRVINPDEIMIYSPDIFPSAVTKKPMLDTHIHSKFSDGSLSPEEIISKADELDLFALTISDHDNLEAYIDNDFNLLKAADEAGLLLLPGSELSSLCHDSSVPQEVNEKVFEDGYFFTDVIGLFPRKSGETNNELRKRLKHINSQITRFRNMFQKCVIFTLFKFMEEFPDAGFSMRELLDIAQHYDIENDFDVDVPENLDEARIEQPAYWRDRLRDSGFREKLPRALYEFDVTLRYIVRKLDDKALRILLEADGGEGIEVPSGDIEKYARSIKAEKIKNGITISDEEARSEARVKILAKRLNLYILNHKSHYFGEPIRDVGSVLSSDKKESSGWGLYSTEEIIKLIHDLDGKAILAHPEGQLDKMGRKRFEAWLTEMTRKYRLDGIEAFSRGQSGVISLYLYGLAKRLGLKVTNGSDSHGTIIPGRDIATGYSDSKGNLTTIDTIHELATMNGDNRLKRHMQNIMFSEAGISEIFAAWSDLPATKLWFIAASAGHSFSMRELLEVSPHSYFKAPMLRKNRYNEKVYEYQKRLSMADYVHVGPGESLDDVIRDIFGEEAEAVRSAYNASAEQFNKRVAKIMLIQRMWDKFKVAVGTVSVEDFQREVTGGDLKAAEALWKDLQKNGYLHKNGGVVLNRFWDLDGPDSMKIRPKFKDKQWEIYSILSNSRYKYNPNTLRDHAERKWRAMMGFINKDEELLKNNMPIPRTDTGEVLRLYEEFFGEDFAEVDKDTFSKHIMIHLLLMHELGKFWTGEIKHEEESEKIAKLILDNDYFGFPDEKKKLLTRLVLIHHHIEYINDDTPKGEESRRRVKDLIAETAQEDYFSEKEMQNIMKMMTIFRMADRAQSEYFGFLFEPHFQHFKRMYGKAGQMVKEMYYQKHHAPTPTVKRYISNSLEGCSFVTAESKEPVLLRVPVETIENCEEESVKDLLKTLQGSYNVYVRFYYASGLGEAERYFYTKYDVAREDLPEGFVPLRSNTITLMASDKDEEISDSVLRMRISGEVGISPENTIIIPVGYQNDRMGLLLSTILGIKVLEVSRHIVNNNISSPEEDQRLKDLVQKDILEIYQDLCPPEHRKSMADLTPADIIALAHSGSINDILKTVKKLIRLLPILPLDIEDIRDLYDHAKNTLVAA